MLAVLPADHGFDQSSLPSAASTAKMPRLLPLTIIVRPSNATGIEELYSGPAS